MKILHVITSLEVGGAQRLLSDVLPIMSTTEDVSLLVYERKDNDFQRRIESAGINVISLDEHNYYNAAVVFRMRRIFKEYDIVHAHLFPTVYWASLACRGLRTKLVYTEHSTSNSRRDKWYFWSIEKLMYARYDKIISISPQTQDALQCWLRTKDNRFVVINNGVDIRRFSDVKKPIIPKSLIMVSRFAASKDQETVIRAMTKIDQDMTVRFVGDGPNLAHCQQVAKECGVEDRVLFMGSRSDVAELIAESYIGIQSSNWEGFGLTAVEIMACGKPIIATDVNGLREVVKGAGELFELGNSKQLVDILSRLASDATYYNEVANRCRQRASEYDIHEMVDKYIKTYEKLI